MRIAHVSDLHFGAALPDVVDGLRDRLIELSPDLVVASGDFTMAGRHEEYRAAREAVESWGLPVLATPGNHDVPVYNLWERFTRPFARYERHMGPATMDRYAGGDTALLSLNSARPWDLSFNWSHGRLSDRQVDEADAFFRAHGEAGFKALVVHHPFVVPEDLPGFRTIGNGDAMLEVLALHRVDAVLTGHLHRQFRTARRLPLEEDEHTVELLQVATATSSRHRDQPNAFAVIRTGRGRFEYSTEVWNGERFSAVSPATHLEEGARRPERISA